MASVTLGDGRTLTVGDEFLKLSPADQQSWVNDVASSLPPLPTAPPKPRTLSERATGLYRAADEGAIRGVAGLVGFPGTLADLIGAGAKKVGLDLPSESNLPRAADVEKKIRAGPLYQGAEPYQPQGTAEEVAQTAGEFLPGALLTGGMGSAAVSGPRMAASHLATKVAPRVAAETLLPTAGSEIAGRTAKEVVGPEAEAWARFGGALVGGGASALATRPGTAERALGPTVGGLTREQIDQAQQLIADAARGPNPVRMTWPEALSQVAERPVLSDTMRHLEASPQTADQMAAYYGARTGEVERRVAAETEQLAPGVRPRASSVGPTAGGAATDALEAARRDINTATAPLYAAGERHALTPGELTAIRQFIPGFDEAAATVRNNPQLYRNVAHLPEHSVGFLDAVKQQLQHTARRQREGLEPGTGNATIAAGLESDAGLIRHAIEFASTRASGETAQAIATQAARREAEITPLTQGPFRELANRDIPTKEAIAALFPQHPNVGSAPEITEAVTRMAQQHPTAAADLVRQHVENAFSAARTDLRGGRNQGAGAKFRQSIIGDPQQRENLQAAVTAALPDGDVRWRGFSRLMDIMEATGTRQGIGSKTAYNQNLDQVLGQTGISANAMKFLGDLPRSPLRFMSDKFQQFRLGQNKAELARILTDPNSAGMLRTLAESNPGSQAALRSATRLLNYGQAAHAHSQERERLRRVEIDTSQFK